MLKKLTISVILIIFSVYNTLQIAHAEAKPINDVYVVILIIDGLNYKTFERDIKKGITPNIQKYFIDDGAIFTNMLTIFPSTSSTAYQAFASGLYPGHAGLCYLSWFDRSREKLINYFSLKGHKHQDLDFLNFKALLNPAVDTLHPPSTIFDLIKEHGENSAGLFSSFNLNASNKYPKIPIRPFWSVFGAQKDEMLDIYAYKDLKKLFAIKKKYTPRFTFVGLYGFDSLGHHYGANSKILSYNLQMFDNFLGDFIKLLKEKEIFNKTYIIIAADHGMHNTPKGKVGLSKILKNAGLKVYPGTSPKDKYDIVAAKRGVATAHIYVKSEKGWKERPTLKRMQNFELEDNRQVNIIDQLKVNPAIKFVVARDGFDKVHIFSKTGHSLVSTSIHNFDNWYKYEIINGHDPLAITETKAKGLIGKGFYTNDYWNYLTANHIYPIAVTQLSQIFADGRSGDIYIIPEDDYLFYRNKTATHGSIIREDMHVPFLIRGPTVPKGKFKDAIITDLYPTMIEWFGLNVDKRNYDGQNLFTKKKPSNKRLEKITANKKQDQKIINKLTNLRNKLLQQKENPKTYSYTPEVDINANIWLVNQQIERLR